MASAIVMAWAPLQAGADPPTLKGEATLGPSALAPATPRGELVHKPSPERCLPDPLQRELGAYVRESAYLYQLPAALLWSVMETSSQLYPEFRGGDGRRGLFGQTFSAMVDNGVRVVDSPREQVLSGARTLYTLAKTWDGEIALAVASFFSTVEEVRRHRGIPPDVRRQVDTVLEHFDAYRACLPIEPVGDAAAPTEAVRNLQKLERARLLIASGTAPLDATSYDAATKLVASDAALAEAFGLLDGIGSGPLEASTAHRLRQEVASRRAEIVRLRAALHHIRAAAGIVLSGDSPKGTNPSIAKSRLIESGARFPEAVRHLEAVPPNSALVEAANDVRAVLEDRVLTIAELQRRTFDAQYSDELEASAKKVTPLSSAHQLGSHPLAARAPPSARQAEVPRSAPVTHDEPSIARAVRRSDEQCTPGYHPCIALGPDVDCAGGRGNGPRYVEGPVRVTGSDPYDLDRDGDGIGCE